MQSKILLFLLLFCLKFLPINFHQFSSNKTKFWHSNCSFGFQSNAQNRHRRSDSPYSNQRTWSISSFDSAEIDEFRRDPFLPPIAKFRDLPIQRPNRPEQLEAYAEEQKATLYERLMDENDMVMPQGPSRIPNRLQNFYSSTFQPPKGGWAENWKDPDRIIFPEPLHRDPTREWISGRPGGEEAYRNYQRGLADYERNRGIRRNFEGDFQMELWNQRLRERQRDPLVSPFRAMPKRASEIGEEEAGPSHGRRQPFGGNPDRHLDWNERSETLERARQRLGYLGPPRGKPPKPKGMPKLPGYYEAKYKNHEPDAGSLPNYYESLGRFDPRKIKMGIKMQVDRAKQFAQNGMEKISNIDWLFYPSEEGIPRREMGRHRAQQAAIPSVSGFVGRGPSATSRMPKGGEPPISSQPLSPGPLSGRSRTPSQTRTSMFSSRRGSGRSSRSSPAPPPTRRNSRGWG